jgi:hypothetical protein
LLGVDPHDLPALMLAKQVEYSKVTGSQDSHRSYLVKTAFSCQKACGITKVGFLSVAGTRKLVSVRKTAISITNTLTSLSYCSIL